MGRAEDLFERLEREGEPFVDELIAVRKSEEAFLDFKRSANDGNAPRLHDHDRNHLAKALSGFGNSEGGVVVWGVDCSDRDRHGDVARGKVPIHDVARFVSQLESAVSGLTVPPVQGTRSIVLGVSAGGGGIAATLIPKSYHAPHQWVQERRYFIRAGSAFEPITHGVLAGLFGRAPQPVVLPKFALAPLWSAQGAFLADASIALENDGNVVAEDLFVSSQVLCDLGDAMSIGISPRPGGDAFFQFTAAWGRDLAAMSHKAFRLPPGASMHVMKVRLILRRPPPADFKLKIVAGCSGAPPYTEYLSVTAGDLQDLYTYAQERWSNENARAQVDWHSAAARMFGKPAHWEQSAAA
jgi:hypothetical protein